MNLETANLIQSLLSSLPSWFVMLCIVGYGLHKFCGRQIDILIKLIGKPAARRDRLHREERDMQVKKDKEQDARLSTLETNITSIMSDTHKIIKVLVEREGGAKKQ